MTGNLTGTMFRADEFYVSENTFIDEAVGGSYKRLNVTVGGDKLIYITKGGTSDFN